MFRLITGTLTFFVSVLGYVSFASAAPFAIKDIKLGMSPDAYPALDVKNDCRVEGLGTLLQCFEGMNGVDSHILDIRTTIAGETCRVASLYFTNLARPPRKAEWVSSSILFVCEGYQSTFDNLKRTLIGKFGAPDHETPAFVDTMPWLYWYDGAFELALWNPPHVSGFPREVWVMVDDKDLQGERERLESRIREEDI